MTQNPPAPTLDFKGLRYRKHVSPGGKRCILYRSLFKSHTMPDSFDTGAYVFCSFFWSARLSASGIPGFLIFFQ